jgi:adenylate kinase family enzyme
MGWPMKRIVIIGNGGSGKSTLARRLGDLLGIEVIHLDARFWNPGWVETPKPQWFQTVAHLVAGDSWIIDGNFGSTMDLRLAAADTIIFLDLHRTRCLLHVLKRQISYFGRTRPDMADGCPEKVDWEFLKWIWDYPVQSRPAVMEKIALHRHNKQVIIFRSPAQISRFVDSLRRRMAGSGDGGSH